MMWEDMWNGRYMKQLFPRLFSYAKDDIISLASFMANNNPEAHFHLPISQQAMEDLIALQSIVDELQHTEPQLDKWIYCWGLGNYSSRKYYALMFSSIKPPIAFLVDLENKGS